MFVTKYKLKSFRIQCDKITREKYYSHAENLVVTRRTINSAAVITSSSPDRIVSKIFQSSRHTDTHYCSHK